MTSKSSVNSVNRRQFVKGGTAVAAGVALFAGARSYSRIPGSNNELRFAVIGFRSRGKAHIDAINLAANARLTAICDADEKVLAGHDPDNKDLFRTNDLREILERDDIDAVASATPNHWHALLTMLACEAGKHVYIEKPISHNMQESRAIVQAARKHDRIVQCGFQNRSDTGLISFFSNLRDGKYGNVVYVHGTCHRSRESIGKLDSPLTVPDNINYDLWLGPAADEPLTRPGLHYDWHWDFNTGNGDVGNQGPHEWDMMNWALGDPDDLPTSMVACGNRFGWNDAGNTPNVMAVAGQSQGTPFCFEVMDLKGGRRAPFGKGVGVIIETDKGRFVGGRGGGEFVFASGESEKFQRDDTQRGQDGTPSHLSNFVEAVHSGKRDSLRSECAVAANSSAMAHMANISFQLGKEASAEQLESVYGGDIRQRDMLARLRESTMLYALENKGTGLNEPWLSGPKLTFNNSVKEFEGDHAEAANRKMTRDYRRGFELPAV